MAEITNALSRNRTLEKRLKKARDRNAGLLAVLEKIMRAEFGPQYLAGLPSGCEATYWGEARAEILRAKGAPEQGKD
jgi:hypothetical protein